MCGIVAAISHRNIVPILLEGLRKLEYRGYDSAGLAVVNGSLHRLRSVGRVASLTDMAAGRCRRARGYQHIHAGPRTAPHRSAMPTCTHQRRPDWRWCTAVSWRTTRASARLIALGYAFTSDTDTGGCSAPDSSLLRGKRRSARATYRATSELVGAYAIVVSEQDPYEFVVARHGAGAAGTG